jgi:hypothetical protein
MRVLMLLADKPSPVRQRWTQALRCSVVISSTVRLRDGPTTSSKVLSAALSCPTLEAQVRVPYHGVQLHLVQ